MGSALILIGLSKRLKKWFENAGYITDLIVWHEMITTSGFTINNQCDDAKSDEYSEFTLLTGRFPRGAKEN